MADFMMKKAIIGEVEIKVAYTNVIDQNDIQVPFRFGGALRSHISEIAVLDGNLIFGFFVVFGQRYHFVGLGSLADSTGGNFKKYVGLTHSQVSRGSVNNLIKDISSIWAGYDVAMHNVYELPSGWNENEWHWVACHVTPEEPDIKLELEWKIGVGKTKPTTWDKESPSVIHTMVFEIGIPEISQIGMFQFSKNIGTLADKYTFWDEVFADQLTT